MVVTEVRKYMEAAVEKLTPAKAQEMARSLLEGQSKGREQVQRLAQDLMDWSNQTRERMSEMVRREVARQLKAMGVASRDEVDALKARVRELERGGRSAGKTTAKSAVKSPSKTTAGRPAKTVAKAPGKTGGASAAKSTATSAARRSTGPAGEGSS
ncbi:MAG: phasin family protein [Actinomycetota bacterium]